MANHSPLPWRVCQHLKSPIHDKSCSCGYAGSVWSEGSEKLLFEMGSRQCREGDDIVPNADRETQIADAQHIVFAVNTLPSLQHEVNRLRAALEAITMRSQTDELGTSKVQDMAKLANDALGPELP